MNKNRVFYVFSVKEEFVSLYRNNPSTLYNTLKQIYYMHQEDINYGFTLFSQLVRKIDKEDLDRDLFLRLHKEVCYNKRENKHIINHLYKDEVSVLEVKKTHLKLETNKEISSYFDVLLNYDWNYFLCDFKNQDFFWLASLKLLV